MGLDRGMCSTIFFVCFPDRREANASPRQGHGGTEWKCSYSLCEIVRTALIGSFKS